MIRFHDGTSTYALRPRRGEEPGLPSEREARSVLERWLATEPWRAQLQWFATHEIRVDARTDDALVDRLWALLSARGLVLSRDERLCLQDASAGLEAADMLAEPLQAATREDETHWIHVIIVDQDDQPLAGVRYRIELTDGQVREGRTNAEGGVYVDEIPPGTCKIALLEHDEAEWGLAR